MIRLIAYMTTPEGLTGAPRRLLTLAGVLKSLDIEPCIASQPDSELLQAAKIEECETAPVSTAGVLALRQGALFGGGFWFRLRMLIDLLRQNGRLLLCIRSRGADAVWIRGSKGITFGALGAVMSCRPLIWDVDYELPSRGVVRWLHRLGLWSASAVVFQHPTAADSIFGEGLATQYRDKFHTIIPGIDLPTLEPYRATHNHKQSLENDPFVVLQVGTICDRKNPKVFVEAIGQLRQALPQQALEVWLVGGIFDQAYADDLLRQVESQGLNNVIVFLGWRSDVHELMAAADLLVMPSKDEGVPNTVQEAMAIGLPVAVSRAGGMPEIVEEENTGWILEADDSEAWSRRIRWCLENREANKEIGQCAATYAHKHFGTENWGAHYARIIRGAVCESIAED